MENRIFLQNYQFFKPGISRDIEAVSSECSASGMHLARMHLQQHASSRRSDIIKHFLLFT